MFMRHLVLVTLCGWLSCVHLAGCVLDRIRSTKCRINTVVSPDDGPVVIRNM